MRGFIGFALTKEDHGMPLKTGEMTVRECEFVRLYVDLRDAKQAAKLAGYTHADTQGAQILARPGVQHEIQRLNRLRLNTELVPLAHAHLRATLAEGSAASVRDKNTAAGIVLKYAADAEASSAPKSVDEMTRAELDAHVNAARRRLSNLASPIIEGEVVEDLEGEDIFA
jgi:phage terminase small subunit